MSVDGNPVDTSMETKAIKAKLAAQIARQTTAMQAMDPEADKTAIELCRGIIDRAKASIIALNPPQNQLLNLHAAMARRHALLEQQEHQVAQAQCRIRTVRNELRLMGRQEATLIEKLTSPSRHIVDHVNRGNEDRRMSQLQFQFNSMATQMHHDQSQLATLITALRMTPNMPAEALYLISVLLPRTAAPAPPVVLATHPEVEHTAPLLPIPSPVLLCHVVHRDTEVQPVLPVVADYYPITDGSGSDGFVDYGPSSNSNSRHSPYGEPPLPETIQQPFSPADYPAAPPV